MYLCVQIYIFYIYECMCVCIHICVYVCVYIHIYTCIYTNISIYIWTLILRNWLMSLWRLTSPQICGQRALETQGSRWCSSRLKVGRLEIQEEQMFPFESKGRKKLAQRQSGRSSSLLFRDRGRCFMLVVPSTDWARPTHIRGENLFT